MPVILVLWLGVDTVCCLFLGDWGVGGERVQWVKMGVIGYVRIDILGRMRRGFLRLLGGAFGMGCAAGRVRTEVTEE